jgi:hypothetical protein
MNKAFSYLRNVWFLLGLSLVLNIISWLIIAIQIKPTSEIVPLHYNIFYGADLSGKGYYLYFLPFAGLVILIANYIFFRYAINKEPFAARTLIAVGLIVQVFVVIAVQFLKSIII